MDDLRNRSCAELLALHVDVLAELRERGVIRSENIPTGDLAEFLFCRAFSWRQEPNSTKGVDAEDGEGNRYQIKGRRIHGRSRSRQLSQIRDLDSFQYLATVLFGERFEVFRAALIPNGIVCSRGSFVKHTNSYRFVLTDDIWNDAGVADVTKELREVASREMQTTRTFREAAV